MKYFIFQKKYSDFQVIELTPGFHCELWGSGWRQESALLICQARYQDTGLETRLGYIGEEKDCWEIQTRYISVVQSCHSPDWSERRKLIEPVQIRHHSSQFWRQRGWLTGLCQKAKIYVSSHSWMLVHVNIIASRLFLLTSGPCAVSEQYLR